MSIAKEDLLTLAGELVESASEVHWRSGVSRAYYAAYHGCQEWHEALPMPGILGGPTGVHQSFLHQLRNPAPETKGDIRVLSKALAPFLESLRNSRNEADYHLDSFINQEYARNALERAKHLLDKISN